MDHLLTATVLIALYTGIDGISALIGIAGAAPWVVIAYNVVAADEVPGFVIGIFVSLFLFFNSFALNQWLPGRLTWGSAPSTDQDRVGDGQVAP